jgi:hypothetical protein
VWVSYLAKHVLLVVAADETFVFRINDGCLTCYHLLDAAVKKTSKASASKLVVVRKRIY